MNIHLQASGSHGRQWMAGAAGGVALLLLLLLSVATESMMQHTAVQMTVAYALAEEMVAYCVPPDVASKWAFGAVQSGSITVTVDSTHCQPAVLPVAPRTGNLTLTAADLASASLLIGGERFGGQTTLGTGLGDFFTSAAPYANELHGLTGIPTSVILAQWANETAYGQAMYGWNFGNIKDFGIDPSGHTYMAYTTPDAGVRAEAELLLSNVRYAGLFGHGGDVAAAAAAWGRSGWAGSCYDLSSGGGDWSGGDCSADASGAGSMLTNLVSQYNLTQYDTAPTQVSDSGGGMIVPVPQLPADLTAAALQRVDWAMAPGNDQAFGDAECERFVESVFGHAWQAPTAVAAESGPTFHRTANLGDVPVGAAIYFGPTADNALAGVCPGGCGHTAIYLGNGVMWSSSNSGFHSTSVAWWQANSAPLVGWRAS